MSHRSRRWSGCAAAALAVVVTAGACTDNNAASGDGSDSDRVLEVESSADGCQLDRDEAPSGNLTFLVENTGNQVTEFYLYRSDGSTIVGEVENIGPGLSREMVVRVDAGDFVTACKPGMVGEGIRGELTITDSSGGAAPSAAEMDELAQAGIDQYREFVGQQADALLIGTQAFAEAYQSGQDEQAKSLYAPTRAALQSIAPVAAQAVDLDALDGGPPAPESGEDWAGWHRIEADLWGSDPASTLEPEQRQQVADQLVDATALLVDALQDVELTEPQIAQVAVDLLDDLISAELTGQTDALAGTSLYGAQADLDGARSAYLAVRPVAVINDPDLVESLDDGFLSLQAQLDALGDGEGFVEFSTVTAEQIDSLTADASALADTLAALSSAVGA